jgi:hypothetical protein
VEFEIVGEISNIEEIAINGSIRDLARLQKTYGKGRWRKLKGTARIRLSNGKVQETELHWLGKPPPISMRFSLPSAKNPIDRLSGDQKGEIAPSVPAKGCAVTASSGRIQRRDAPSPEATKTSFRPSGEIANERASLVNGVLMSTRISGSGAGLSRKRIIASDANPSAKIPATLHARRERVGRTPPP